MKRAKFWSKITKIGKLRKFQIILGVVLAILIGLGVYYLIKIYAAENQISNTATITYGLNGVNKTGNSNTVTTTVVTPPPSSPSPSISTSPLTSPPIYSPSLPATLSVNLKANNSDGPVSVGRNKTVNLTWTSTAANACTASGAWTGSKQLSGREKSPKIINTNTIFILTCTNAKGETKFDQVTVNLR